MTKAGALKSVYVVNDDGLRVNGGRWLLQSGAAIKVRGYTSDTLGSRRVIHGDAQPVYVLGENDVRANGGRWLLKSGQPIPVTDVIGTARGVIQGKAIPVWPVDDDGNYDFTFLGYIAKVLTPNPSVPYDPTGLIGFWPLNETSGTTAIDYSGLGHDGTYVGVTLGDPGVPGMGFTSPFFDGVNDFVNIYSAALAAAFSGAELTITGFGMVNPGAWTDGVSRRAVTFETNANNQHFLKKDNTNNVFEERATNGGVSRLFQIIDGGADFFHFALTVSESADEAQGYLRGLPIGGVLNGLGVYAGALLATRTLIGALTTAPLLPWHGWQGPCTLWSRALTPAEIAYLSEP